MEEINPTQQGHQRHETQTGATTQEKPSDNALVLLQHIERDANELVGILRSYVQKAGLASNNEEIQEVALEVLDETYIEAEKTAKHFDPARSPRAWLLGIASNIVKQKKTGLAKRSKEIPLSTLNQDQKEESDLLTLALNLVHEGMEQQVEAAEEMEYMLSLVAESDREVLRLSIIEELDGETLAQRLGCPYTAAQVRLCRAKKRLRKALEKSRGERNE
jgi:RNA polymerase sigma-70 factor (ECF subfamily)